MSIHLIQCSMKPGAKYHLQANFKKVEKGLFYDYDEVETLFIDNVQKKKAFIYVCKIQRLSN